MDGAVSPDVITYLVVVIIAVYHHGDTAQMVGYEDIVIGDGAAWSIFLGMESYKSICTAHIIVTGGDASGQGLLGQKSVAAVVLVGLGSCYVGAVAHCLTGDSTVGAILIILGPTAQDLAYKVHLACAACSVDARYGLCPAGLCGALCCHTAKVIIIGDNT